MAAIAAALAGIALGAAPASAGAEASFDAKIAEAKQVALMTGPDARAAAGTAPACDPVAVSPVTSGSYTGVFPDCTSATEDGHQRIRITDRPDHGNLNVHTDGGYFYYVPDAGYSGTDSVKFIVLNDVGDSAEQTAEFTVGAAAPSAPNCYMIDGEVQEYEGHEYGSAVVRKGTSRTLNGLCFDPDGQKLSFEVTTPPTSGTLVSGPVADSPTLTYTPAADAVDGSHVDAVVRVKDESGALGPQTRLRFDIVAADYNTAPECGGSSANPEHWEVVEQGDTQLLFSAYCWDAEGDAVTLSVVSQPANATVTVGEHGMSLTPSAGSGETSFTFKGTDALGLASEVATVNVKLVPPHADPSCTALTLSVAAATRTEGDVVCADADADPMHTSVYPESHGSYSWAKHGDLEVSSLKDGKLHFAYTPDAGFTGADGFIVLVSDSFDSPEAETKVTLNVGATSGGGNTGGGNTPPTTPTAPVVTPEQLKAAMLAFLSSETVEFLQLVSGANKKGLDPGKAVLSLGSLGPDQLPNGGTGKFDVYDKAPKVAKAAAKNKKSGKPRLLGSTKVTLAKGATKKVQVELNRKGKALLKKKGKVKLTVQATLTDALTGASAKQVKSYTFKVKKKKRK